MGNQSGVIEPQRSVAPLFSTPLFISQLGQPDSQSVAVVKQADMRRVKANNGWSSVNTRILDGPDMQYLKGSILREINAYAFEALGLKRKYQFQITNSWVMKHQKGDFSHAHAHENSLISGVYYVETYENSGPILFSKPYKEMNLFPAFFGWEFERRDILNADVWPVLPKNGMLVLFPSHLTHSVEPSQADADRYCVAFNVFVKGQFGSEDTFSSLEIL